MQIILNYMNRRVSVDMRPDETVQDILEKVKEVQRIPIKRQRLVGKGRLLSTPSETLKQCGLGEGDVVYILIRLRNPEAEEDDDSDS